MLCGLGEEECKNLESKNEKRKKKKKLNATKSVGRDERVSYAI